MEEEHKREVEGAEGGYWRQLCQKCCKGQRVRDGGFKGALAGVES